ncbi:hypothetical protein KRP22_006859 [Phytophthora ramorum]|nr:hypothetical protein KRP22_2009 [Phytophthora ramorum]
MPANHSQSRPRKDSIGANKVSSGLQLLSPTLQQSIQNSTSKHSASHPAGCFGWSTTPPASYDAPGLGSSFVSPDADLSPKKDEDEPAAFDFDGFTLASVRGRKGKEEQGLSEAATRPTSRVARSSSTERRQQPDASADYCAFYYNDLDGSKPNPLGCSMGSVRTTATTEDFEMSRRLHQQSFQKRRGSVMNRESDANRTTFQTSATAAAAGFPMAKKKELTAVTMRGWLQKRKGLMIKRWKPYYCLFKSDDSLCLYSSEDTVNGKLEQRYQVLRVQLTDKNDSFHIIGVDADGAPRREEFRASVSPEWTRWFQVLGKFFDEKSMIQALARKPELTIPTAFDESEGGRTRDSEDWVDTLSDVATKAAMPTYHHYDERRSYFSHRKQSSAAVRDSFDGRGDDLTSTVSTYSGSSAPSSGSNNQPIEAAAKPGNQKLSDCPMIERNSQAAVPILEVGASVSKLDAGLAAAMSSSFSWTK